MVGCGIDIQFGGNVDMQIDMEFGDMVEGEECIVKEVVIYVEVEKLK